MDDDAKFMYGRNSYTVQSVLVHVSIRTVGRVCQPQFHSVRSLTVHQGANIRFCQLPIPWVATALAQQAPRVRRPLLCQAEVSSQGIRQRPQDLRCSEKVDPLERS